MEKRFIDKVQDLTDNYINDLEKLLNIKFKDFDNNLMEVYKIANSEAWKKDKKILNID